MFCFLSVLPRLVLFGFVYVVVSVPWGDLGFYDSPCLFVLCCLSASGNFVGLSWLCLSPGGALVFMASRVYILLVCFVGSSIFIFVFLVGWEEPRFSSFVI